MGTISGNTEGYLIKIDEEYGSIVYCILDEGKLQYFNGKGGSMLGELQLTGNKVSVNLLRDENDSLPNRFIVSSKKRSDAKRESVKKLFPLEHENYQKLLFSASTSEVQENWATAILNWNKHCWEDAETVFSYKDESQALMTLIKVYNVKEKPRKITQPGSGHAMPVR
jgi:hypothetical protein